MNVGCLFEGNKKVNFMKHVFNLDPGTTILLKGWKIVDEIQRPFTLVRVWSLVQYTHFQLMGSWASQMNLKNVQLQIVYNVGGKIWTHDIQGPMHYAMLHQSAYRQDFLPTITAIKDGNISFKLFLIPYVFSMASPLSLTSHWLSPHRCRWDNSPPRWLLTMPSLKSHLRADGGVKCAREVQLSRRERERYGGQSTRGASERQLWKFLAQVCEVRVHNHKGGLGCG